MGYLIQLRALGLRVQGGATGRQPPCLVITMDLTAGTEPVTDRYASWRMTSRRTPPGSRCRQEGTVSIPPSPTYDLTPALVFPKVSEIISVTPRKAIPPLPLFAIELFLIELSLDDLPSAPDPYLITAASVIGTSAWWPISIVIPGDTEARPPTSTRLFGAASTSSIALTAGFVDSRRLFSGIAESRGCGLQAF